MKFILWGLVVVGVVVGAVYVGSRLGDQSLYEGGVGISVGDSVPAFSVTTTDGVVLTASELRGKVVVITSAAMWCSTCVMEAQQFAGVYHSLRNSDVVFLTIDIDPRESREDIERFKKNYVTPWHYATAGNSVEIMDVLQLNRFEITYVIDREGVIQFKDQVITSFDELDNAILPLL